MLNVLFSGFHETSLLKSGTKILPFYLIGGILLRNYHPTAEKSLFGVAKRAEMVAKELRLAVFY